MKFSKIVFVFAALNIVTVIANAQTNYLDGLNYSTTVNNAIPGPLVPPGTGVINSSTSIALTTGTLNGSIALPERVNNAATYTPSLAAGNYTFSFNYSGPAINFIGLSSSGCSTGGGGGMPACPTSGLGVFYRVQGASTSTYLNVGNAVIIGKNALTFSLSAASPIYLGMSLWNPSTSFTITGIYLADGTFVPSSGLTAQEIAAAEAAAAAALAAAQAAALRTSTQQSVANTAQALQGTYALQNSVLANSFTYDCTLFDKNNICVSGGARNTAVQAVNGLNSTSALLIAAYRPTASVRIGAYADQNLSVNNGGSTVNLSNNTPLIGLFAAWNQRQDDTGTEVRGSIAYGQKDTTINRQVVGTSQAGTGSSTLTSQGAQLTAKYGFGLGQAFVVSPYAGVRYSQNNMGGYTEGASAGVTAPLTFGAVNTNATTLLAGVGGSFRGIPKTNLFASAGIESDTNTAAGTVNGTSTTITGLTPVNFNANPVKNRPTATVGATYDVEKNQRLGVTGIYRQEAYQAVSTTTVMATYTVGF
ncbi:autotransporter outer membrane beta-barrel domain-containing protein [Polynucleobacter sp. 86C-FISCH]|uniref:autotransporter outer membrane beta-barrel domain-containing protein n=1 Tax=Polynucleobacter sp. 86C-FISCH TaxID=2689101 RepID=UPI001C0C3D3B|nr:autotransporter outer membrane beta-barrel domain-containing protein [Polynucleobacter sp. 86C-FISCH]MBU3595418.1 autotransporter outer membrane beta-barrel domain-containing protein [Polynucleobacter sp. 86C-FISCH]